MSCRHQPLSRRELLRRSSTGFGALAFAGLFGQHAVAAGSPGRPRRRAKNVIFCYMSGGVSHVDSFDPKPKLQQLHGKPMPVQIARTQFNANGNVIASVNNTQSTYYSIKNGVKDNLQMVFKNTVSMEHLLDLIEK